MIRADLLNRAGISYEAGLHRFMNDAGLYEAVLSAFLDEDMLERAQAAYAAKDNALLLRISHEAKGAGGNAGLDTLFVEASALVKLLRSPSFTQEELTEHYTRFVSAYTAARDGIQAALAG